MNELLMSTEMCMQFLVWSYYYHNILPEPNVSYSLYGKFSDHDVQRLDDLKETLFKCFTAESVTKACDSFRMAKVKNEPCPFPQEALDNMFAHEK